MDKKRLVRGIMRLLCAFIDYVLVMFPVQFVMLYVMQIELSSVDFLFRLLLAVYGQVEHVARSNSRNTILYAIHCRVSGALSIVDWDAVTSAAQAAYMDL